MRWTKGESIKTTYNEHTRSIISDLIGENVSWFTIIGCYDDGADEQQRQQKDPGRTATIHHHFG